MSENEPKPMPGDAVILDGKFSIAKPGDVAFIEGEVGRFQDEAMLNFSYSNFRGPSSKYAVNKIEFVSCSGGPAAYVPMARLRPTGRTHRVNFWRWKDLPRADGGEPYAMDVPLWAWDGSFE